jgi:CRISPR-associated endonuclease/helicase Cas3
VCGSHCNLQEITHQVAKPDFDVRVPCCHVDNRVVREVARDFKRMRFDPMPGCGRKGELGVEPIQAPRHRENPLTELISWHSNAPMAKSQDCFTPNRWAKAKEGRFHRLAWHGLDVAAVLAVGFERRPDLLGRLASTLGMEAATARAMLMALTALHDIGKIMHAFQALDSRGAAVLGLNVVGLSRYERHSYGHDRAGLAVLCALRDEPGLFPQDFVGASRSAVLPLLSAITGHHGGPRGANDDLARYEGRWIALDTATAYDYAAQIIDFFGWRQGFPDRQSAVKASYLLNGLVTLCDWLGSGDEFCWIETDMPLAEYWEGRALPTARSVVDRVAPALLRRPTPAAPRRFIDLFKGFKPYPMQSACARLFDTPLPEGPLLFIIEDATGSGKTEAADYIAHRLLAAGRAEGLYVGLPTMATADKAYLRRKDLRSKLFVNSVDMVLAHSGAAVRPIFHVSAERGDVETGEAESIDWFAGSSKRALLATVGVGTVDQALLAGLRARFAMVRLAGLVRKVLVVDEVHAYDAYMHEILQKVVEAHACHGGSVVLLSATLPSRQRAALVSSFLRGIGAGNEIAQQADALDPHVFPALTLAHRTSVQVRAVPARTGRGSQAIAVERLGTVDEAVARVLAMARDGHSVIWFRNTVDDAISAARNLHNAAADQRLAVPVLYHARFLPVDRARIEADVESIAGLEALPSNRRSRIVVATQVAEQSLDLDFDAVVTDLAPVDVLIQRIGRCRRHPRDRDGNLSPAGVEMRPSLPVLILAPTLDVNAARWLASLLPGAAAIYRDDARLWLGLKHLLDPRTIPNRTRSGPIVLDDDLKPLIESVYDDDASVGARVPPCLLSRLHSAAGTALADRDEGRKNRLDFHDGLLSDMTDRWVPIGDEDVAISAPTRLGESHLVTLAVESNGVLVPIEGSSAPIDASQVRCPCALGGHASDELAKRLAPALHSRRDQRRLGLSACVLVNNRSPGEYRGQAFRDGRPVEVGYNKRFGLFLLQG